jgi:hypothetical protein
MMAKDEMTIFLSSVHRVPGSARVLPRHREATGGELPVKVLFPVKIVIPFRLLGHVWLANKARHPEPLALDSLRHLDSAHSLAPPLKMQFEQQSPASDL